MNDEMSPEALDAFFSKMTEQATWANLEHNLDDVSKDNPDIVAELENFERDTTVALLASLLTLPAHQAQCLRLELLVALALLHCKGKKIAGVEDAARWYAAIGESNSAIGEDPAEDVFVSLIGNDKGDYRLLEGIWEAAGFYTQCMVDVVSSMPNDGIYRPIRRSVQSILRLSDLVCGRATLYRYQAGGEATSMALDTGGTDAPSLRARVTFTVKELRAADIAIADLAHFILGLGHLATLSTNIPGAGFIEQRPLLRSKEGIVVALPSALSIALRHAVIAFARHADQLSNLDRAMANVYGHIITQTQVFGGNLGVSLRWQLHKTTRTAVVVSNVDVGHVMVLQFVLPSMALHSDAGFTDILRLDDETSAFIDQSVATITGECATQPGFQRGMIVRVGCGWGAGFLGTVSSLNDERWQFEWMSGADFVRIGSLSEISPSAFWRIQDAVETIAKAGVELLNINGILNLLGWVRANDGDMVPHDQLPNDRIGPDHPLMLTLPTDMLRDVRMDADKRYDRHRARDNSGRWHRVMRPSAEDYFLSEREMRCYASLDDLDQRKLTGVYEGSSNLWVTLEAQNMQNRDMVFRLWDMVRTWLGRVGSALAEAYGEKAAGQSVKVFVSFLDSDDINRWEGEPLPEDLNAFWRIEKVKEQQAIRIVFADGFLAGFRAADNRAERAVVRALGSAYASLLRLGNGEEVGHEVERLAVSNDTARSFHLMEGREFSDRVSASLTRPLLSIESVESGAARIELGWRAAAPGAPLRYEGKKDAGAFLNRVVDVLVEDITNALAILDRQSTLARLLENCERSRGDENHWHRTAAAVIGLHAGETGMEASIAKQLTRFAGASLTSRLVLEMAICACPLEGGIEPSDMALTRLLARAALLYRIGGLSDAIRFGILPAEVGISPLGDILFKDDLGHMVIEPMLSKATNERFEAHAAHYQEHYAPLDTQPAKDTGSDAASEPAVVDGRTEAFLEIWAAEMGFAVKDGMRLLHAIEAVGVQRDSAIFTMPRSELVALGLSAELDEKTVEAFLGQFMLVTRPKWEEVPAGLRMADIYPWRLGRCLSVAARPLLQFDTAADPTILIAPGLLRTSFRYVFEGAHTGRLNRDFFRTDAMRDQWLGDAREGHTFEKSLTKALLDAGWTVRNSIGFPEILGRNLGFDPGDIDILAWRTDRNDVLIIECKDLSLARNYSEVASQLSEYQGEAVEGRADKLKKHLTRVELARANVGDFARFTSVAHPELVPWLVFSGVSPMHYAEIPALEGTHVGRQEDLLAF